MASDRTPNQVTSLTAKSNAADNADVLVWADPTTHRLLVDALSSIAGNGTIGDGSKDVSSAGTAEAIGGDVSVKKVIITANAGNAGQIWVGGSTVAEDRGIPLNQGFSVTLTPSNLNLIYIDAASGNDGDGITFYYEN